MSFHLWKSLSKFASAEKAARGLTELVAGTMLAFLLLFLFPLVVPDPQILRAYINHSLPAHTLAMAVTVLLAVVAVTICSAALRIWRSPRLKDREL